MNLNSPHDESEISSNIRLSVYFLSVIPSNVKRELQIDTASNPSRLHRHVASSSGLLSEGPTHHPNARSTTVHEHTCSGIRELRKFVLRKISPVTCRLRFIFRGQESRDANQHSTAPRPLCIFFSRQRLNHLPSAARPNLEFVTSFFSPWTPGPLESSSRRKAFAQPAPRTRSSAFLAARSYLIARKHDLE
ncbi:hypothetical protein SCHPADRAFT_736997 [Schizopora paradoxa]|uniref:Uncharacterized protein n=1 Tax=Schizopora paradoxa TaxID=27342 RepID=A0A0H2R085_9AGAM|nr:hypothetical protein SCHPADRAFT_736997 [Schizopora paradoxa]